MSSAHVVDPNVEPGTIQRDTVMDAAGTTPVGYEFEVGVDSDEDFVKLGRKLSFVGPIHERGTQALRHYALNHHGTVNDKERMFIAGLRDAGNSSVLKATNVQGGAKFIFDLATIEANLQAVIDQERGDDAVACVAADDARDGGDRRARHRRGDAGAHARGDRRR